ncbi:PREDICTED: histone H1-like, partial [Rhagoletis zephyria]|uniref:histone H1-like n=1 Tax=Rhagoletis zephyria TaxID=28612 RepID=UPI00081156C8
MKNSQKIVNRTKEIMQNDLRYFKQRPRHWSAAEFVGDNSSGITSWSSKASMQYRKFNAEALVLRALKNISDRNGSSVVAIKKYITNHYPYVDGKFTLSVITKIIRKSLHKGKVVQSLGSTSDGLFKISAGEIRAEQQQEQFKHYKECMKLREQQKLEMEIRKNKCRAQEEKSRKIFQQKLAPQLKRQKGVASAARGTKAKLSAPAARDIIRCMQGWQKSSPSMLAPAKFRLGARTSKTFQQKPQIVDYAHAALETAKIISSEQLRHAIIKNAEYTPYFATFDCHDAKLNTNKGMPIKYERA